MGVVLGLLQQLIGVQRRRRLPRMAGLGGHIASSTLCGIGLPPVRIVPAHTGMAGQRAFGATFMRP